MIPKTKQIESSCRSFIAIIQRLESKLSIVRMTKPEVNDMEYK